MSTNPLSLSAIAKVITRFLFGDIQIPSFLRHYGVFFTGITTGAVAAPALYAYLTRNQHDRGKVQLAVFHIIRLFETRGDYAALLQDPEELLKRMEPEVLAMVKKHLTKAEAGEVVKKLKREYAHLETAEHRLKRLRAAAKPPKVAYLMPAYAPRPRGFLPATSLADSFTFVANGVTSWKTFPVGRDDDDDDDDVDLTTPGEATAVAAPTAEGLHKTAKGKQVEVVAVRHAPQHGSYGLDYDDFSSSEDDEKDDDDEDLPVSMPGAYCNRSAPTPPTVVRMLHGHKCSGTSLSPIQGSPAGTEDLPGAGASAPAAAAPTAATAGSALPFTSWTTSAELEYSSSTTTTSSSSSTTTRLASPAAPVPARLSPATAPQETARLQRESSCSATAPSRPRSPSRRTTPLANTAVTRSSAFPPTTPFKRGRGRGRTGGVERLAPPPVEPQELRTKKGEKSAKVGTPGTRKSSRQTAFQGAYGK